MAIKMEHILLVGVALVLLGVVSVPGLGNLSVANTGGSGSGQPQSIITNEGDSSTVNLNAYTGSWGNAGAKTEAYPTWTVVDDQGNVLVSDALSNSTTSSIGRTLDAYCTGAAYYCTPKLDTKITSATSFIDNVEAYAVPTAANMEIILYDNTGSTACTADDGTNNTADYNGGALGASQNEIYYAKLTNKVADRTWWLGGIASYYCGGEVDDFTLSESGWTEAPLPAALAGASFSHYDDDNTSTSCTYKHYYVPSAGKIALQEWENVKYKFVIDTDDSTGPSANGDSYVGAAFMDASYDVDTNGQPFFGVYKDGDGTEDPGAVGLDENPETTTSGLDLAFCIEPQ